MHTDVNNIAPRLGVAWDPKGDGRTAVRAAFGMFYGSITGNEWNTTADNQPFTVRQSFPTVYTLSDPYRNLPGGVGPFPFNYTPATPRFTLPAQVFGPSLDFVWPLSYQTNVTVEKELGRSFSVTASYVGAFGRNLAGGRRPQLSGVRSRRDDRERQRAAAVSARHDRRRPRVLDVDLRQRLQRPAAERRAPRAPAVGQGVLLVRPRLRGRRLPGRRPAGRAERDAARRERGRTSADRTHSFVLSGVWKIDYLRNSSSVAERACARLDGVGDRHACRPARR